jgi:hypothetical protein
MKTYVRCPYCRKDMELKAIKVNLAKDSICDEYDIYAKKIRSELGRKKLVGKLKKLKLMMHREEVPLGKMKLLAKKCDIHSKDVELVLDNLVSNFHVSHLSNGKYMII